MNHVHIDNQKINELIETQSHVIDLIRKDLTLEVLKNDFATYTKLYKKVLNEIKLTYENKKQESKDQAIENEIAVLLKK